MFKFQEIESVHVEITSNCQASCPMCMRNRRGGLPNPNLRVTDISYEQFKKIFPSTFLLQLKCIYFCGNFGDPIINADLLDIVKYVKNSNNNIKLVIHTNGSAKSISWWKELARELPKNHSVYFALDGLADTHSLYRIGTNFEKVLENAKAFISNNGNATWVFIKFKHNQHQIGAARLLAKEHGFKEFLEKETARFISKPEFDVLDKDGNISYKLEMPDDSKLNYVPQEAVENFRVIFDEDYTINCNSFKDKEIYIDAEQYLWPCCFLGSIRMAYAAINEPQHEIRQLQFLQLDSMVSRLGGLKNINLKNNSIEEIVNRDEWQSIWQDEWYKHKNFTCIRTCSKIQSFKISKTFDQIITRDKIDE
jgi:MoaA/NifB/PqqE/SkfB family radical SAM enzyme